MGEQMSKPTWPEFTEMFDYMAANYPRIREPERVKNLWWMKVKTWTTADMVAAFRVLIENEKHFPPLAKLIAARPIQYRTIREINSAAGFDWRTQERPEHKNQAMDSYIDGMTDAELTTVYGRLGGSERATEFSVKQFRKNPNGIYRTVLRDLLKEQTCAPS